MPIPSSVSDLNASAAANSPQGSDPVGPQLDDYLRAHAAIIRQVSDASKVDAQIHAATAKATPVDADELPLSDSADSFGLKKLTWAGLKAAIKTFVQSSGLSMAGSLTLSADPTSPLEAATKQYVDGKGTVFSSTAENIAGTVSSKSVSPLGVREAFNAGGSAPVYACRAWASFDGTVASPTVRGSGNVSSITKSSTGNYVVNFATQLQDQNYAVAGASFHAANTGGTFKIGAAPTASNCSVNISIYNSGSQDSTYVTVAFFR